MRTLEANPEEVYLLDLGRATFGYDSYDERMTLVLNRVPFVELNKHEQDLQICRNKMQANF